MNGAGLDRAGDDGECCLCGATAVPLTGAPPVEAFCAEHDRGEGTEAVVADSLQDHVLEDPQQ